MSVTAQPAPLTIGVSACLLYPDPNRAAFAKKTLQYMEQSVPRWLFAGGAMPVLIAYPEQDEKLPAWFERYARWLDGLVLHGGVDVSPRSYGETPIDARWQGDAVRDAYEMALVRAFMAAGKPVFGICRGMQLLNVCFGGSLLQDIQTQKPHALKHRDAERYDQLHHTVRFTPGTRLAQLLQQQSSRTINSVHHQAIKQLAPGFVVEAESEQDGIIEAIRYTAGPAWLAGVQWHPEFHPNLPGALDDGPLLRDFLAAAAQAKHTPKPSL